MVSTNDRINFEEISFNPLQSSTLLDNLNESDFDFLNENQQQINTSYFDINESCGYLKNIPHESFSLLHVNIRSLKKNFESLKLLLSEINFNFKVICLTETWGER